MLPAAVLPSQALSLVSSPVFAGLTLSGMTQGSVLFAGAGGAVSQDNSNFLFNAGSHRLAIQLGATAPNESIDTNGAIQVRGSTSGFATTTSVGMLDFATGGLRLLSFGADGSTYGAVNFYQAQQNNGGGRLSGKIFPSSGWFFGPTNSPIDPGAGSIFVGGSAAKAQTFNTLTDASNYENAYMGDWGVSANVATYGTGKAGTGSTRNIQFVVGGTNQLDYGVTNAGAWTVASPVNINGIALNVISTGNAQVKSAGATGNYGYLRLQSGSGFLDLAVRDNELSGALQFRPNGGAAVASLNSTGFIAASNTAIPAGGTAGAGLMVSSTANFGVFFGSGAPTLSAAKGSLYLRSDGTSTSTRAYVNTDGGTTWTNFTTGA